MARTVSPLAIDLYSNHTGRSREGEKVCHKTDCIGISKKEVINILKLLREATVKLQKTLA